MDKFWERYIQSRPAPGASKGAFEAFAAAHREPRTMAQGGRIIGKPGGIVEPGVKYYGNVFLEQGKKSRFAASADTIVIEGKEFKKVTRINDPNFGKYAFRTRNIDKK